MKKHLPLIAVVLIMLLVVWPTRLYYMGGKFYNKGLECEEKGDFYTAALWYGDSAKTYFPFNPYVAKSRNALRRLGDSMEQQGKYEDALHAYRELLASLYAVRSFYQPGKDLIAPTEKKIEELVMLKQGRQVDAP